MLSRLRNLIVVLIMLSVLSGGVYFVLKISKFEILAAALGNYSEQEQKVPEPPPLPPQKLANPPQVVKAIYVTGYSASRKQYLDYLSYLFKKSEINAVVVDIKDYTGLVSYKNGAISDINSLVRFLHEQNIYVIGRIAVFEDPSFAKAMPNLAVYDKVQTVDATNPVLWQDNNGLFWLDPASKDVWDYNSSLAKDAFLHGFDEINFDYIRFPSDGKTENMGFPVYDGVLPKAKVIKEFFQYTRAALAGEKISADLFGQTTINYDDLGIGQIIENAFENFDYISPMVYPSHYNFGFDGFTNPAEHPYEIVKHSIGSAQSRIKASAKQLPQIPLSLPAKLRPWLQDFNMGADYTADMVKQEIKATQDALGTDFCGFMLWNPSNVYTEGALTQEK